MTAFGGHGAMSVSHFRFEIFHEQLLVQPFLVGESPALFFPSPRCGVNAEDFL